MTTDTIRAEQQKASTSTVATPATESLESIVAKVKTDSQQAAQAYLEETKVPHGGE